MSMYSKHNIFVPIKDSENYFICNPLVGSADILDPETAEEFKKGNVSDEKEWLEKGYLVESEDSEQTRYKKSYLDFIEQRDESEVQIFWVPSYACNFGCSYCYQSSYTPEPSKNVIEVQKAFFEHVKREFAGRNKYITVFGGEPLLPGENQKEIIRHLIEEANRQNLSLAFVTNGYSLESYLPILAKGVIREIQVTMDGLGATHDIRRPLKGGGPTFDKISEGIDAALKAGFIINLRVVLDRDNINELPALSRYAKERGWLDNPRFKTQLGRNYELHSCQKDRQVLYDRISMYEDLYRLIQESPEILDFHKPAYSLSKFLFENGEMPDPLFDSCPGCKTEWAFDYSGKVYSCTATVGKSDEALGTFFPESSRNEDFIDEWEERDVTTIPECKNCSLQLACGGGCASVAKNKNGRVQSPDCRPVDKLMAMGIPLYFNGKGE